MKAPPLPVPTEHMEQVQLIRWAHLMAVTGKYPELAHLVAVPNGGRRHIGTAKRLKAEGVRAGYPDLLLDVPRGRWHGWRGELKREQGGTVSPEQKAWHAWLRSQGYRVDVCKGADAMQAALVAYLEGTAA